MPGEKFLRENSKWLIWVLLGGTALWIVGDGKIFSYELAKGWVLGALGIVAYTFKILKDDFAILESQQKAEDNFPQEAREPFEMKFGERK